MISRESLRVVRKRTPATTPAKLNASARLLRTMRMIPATTIGMMIRVCTKDWLSPLERCTDMYTQVTGSISTMVPIRMRPVVTTSSSRGGSPMSGSWNSWFVGASWSSWGPLAISSRRSPEKSSRSLTGTK